ncbi:hypothetical protein GCM10009785_26730 [Brooklawnia cerclae]|uniref:DUF3168 domain-containing protein n=1 Tax=Brooklawnia cerclae TaxID=349934 RepID=A0ABX0SG07_9ACTN|nr:hypothetical protein [Brooklawnia cerclae]NIH57318.1 hypothetical protein [Brooklawnia cerclae]
MSQAAEIEALLTAALPEAISVYDGRIPRNEDGTPRNADGPYAVIYGGAQNPENRRYAATSQTRGSVWQTVCVNNSPEGARFVSDLVVAALDTVMLGDSMIACRSVSDPLENREDPTEWRWSCTVEFTHHKEP